MATNKPILIEELYGKLEFSKEDEKWEVVYTKPKREKKLAQFAANNEITYYLPLVESERIYENRKITFTKPLFSGYIFIKCSFRQKKQLITSGHIVTFIKVPNEIELVEELKQIYISKEMGAEMGKGEYFEKGTKVRIVSGPFEGLTGVVKNQNNVSQIMLRVKILHQAIAVSAKSHQIELIN
ncbi:MAG: KOW motif-containing protein [Candidatus Cloacimonetes bacterium]|nr:KOW motif-containing protein [Candidatus Cloacimonadota bacterium]